MAETAKIINPTKRVICQTSMPLLALRIVSPEKAGAVSKKEQRQKLLLIAYINCSAE